MLSPVLLAVAALAFSSGATATTTPNSIEGVWSFSGGAVAIQSLPNGRFQGTVVSPTTTFASCPHPEGQVMWTNMQRQADGSFWGLHQWYHGSACEEVPILGHTAWRVLTDANGLRTLKVCFDSPGGTTQPTIAANGREAHVTYACTTSKPLASLPQTGGSGSGLITFGHTVILPSSRACVSRSKLKISIRDPKYDPLKEVVVKLKGKKIADVKGVKRLKKGITLKKLPNGTYKLSVVATTILKQRLSGSKTYRSCSRASGKIKLHHAKKPTKKPRH
jgi:hypothetical protein